MIINFTKKDGAAETPTRGSKYSAGLDLYAHLDVDCVEIPAGTTVKIGTGIGLEIPEGFFGAVFARSGFATKKGLRPANCVGVIDADYRGEVIVALHNDSTETVAVCNGDRIAQLVIIPYLNVELNEVDKLTDTVRGAGGFGSTGVSKNKEPEYEQLSLFDMIPQ